MRDDERAPHLPERPHAGGGSRQIYSLDKYYIVFTVSMANAGAPAGQDGVN
eukprot:SAG31_NODE_10221_length_1168_cov_1.579981_2_plen_51_part_00